MCNRLRQGGATYQVNDEITVGMMYGGRVAAQWTGFARSERIENWLKVWEPVVIPVEAFAERSHATGENVWLQEGSVLAGLLFKGQVRVVTREATLVERDYFGHARVPLKAEGAMYAAQ